MGDSKQRGQAMILRIVAVVIGLTLGAMAQSSYPSLYAGIGDGVYKSADGYKTLMKLESFKSEHGALKAYVEKARQLKTKGFALDNEENKEQSKEYIAALRELAKEKKALDRTVLRKIRMLKEQKAYAELETLAKNPDPMIAGAAEVKRMQHSKPPGKERAKGKPEDDLRRSLMELKGRLLSARSENSPEVHCLNDITAVNYWMAEAETFKKQRDWCKAHDACVQTINFERAAAKSCDAENPLYKKWRERSEKYRIEYKNEYAKACR